MRHHRPSAVHVEALTGTLAVCVIAERRAPWMDRLEGSAATVRQRPPRDEGGGVGADLKAALGAADCVVLDGALDGLPALARQVHDADAAVQAIVVVAPEARPPLERAFLFAPGVGELWLTSPAELDTTLLVRAADVTRRRRQFGRTRARLAEASLVPEVSPRRARASEAFLSGLLRLLPDPVFSTDENGRVLSANDAGEALYARVGRTGDEMTLWHLLRPTSGSIVPAASSDTEMRYEATVSAADGTESVFDVHAAPVRVDDLHAWAVIARDLTERHQLQQQLEEQATELEAQASELAARQTELLLRTEAAERAQESAVHARQAADAANEAKSQFLATMSHELRTPLNAIIGYAQLLDLQIRGSLNDEQRSFLSRLQTSGQHLLTLINDVLDLAKIEAGTTSVRTLRGQASEAAHAAVALAAPQARQRGVEISLDDGTSPLYAGDPDRVRQVILNLLSNAVKFTAPGGRIVISFGWRDDTPGEATLSGEGPWSSITVEDTGIGIAADQQAAIFDPFVQVQGGWTRTAGGTGLGLAISRRLARLMGGDVSLRSVPGTGSAFTLWLPAPADGTVEESAEHRRARARPQSAQLEMGGLRELGLGLRDDLEAILEAVAAGIRADATFADVRRTPKPEMEDHWLAFLADLSQSLVILDDAGAATVALQQDGVSILEFIAARHGEQRRRIGWTDVQLSREYDLLVEELTSRLRRHEAGLPDDVHLAIGAVTRLVARARVASLSAYRAEPLAGTH